VIDDQLIQQTLAGEKNAFGELVEKYQGRLYNTMIQVVGNSEDAYDVVQEAFFQAYLRLETFRQTSKFYTWLYRIAFNVAMGIRRRKRPRPVDLVSGYDLAELLVDQNLTPDEIMISGENIQAVQMAIADLDKEFRAVIILRELEDFAYEEIAEILDVPLGTVRSRLHRARTIIKEKLERRKHF